MLKAAFIFLAGGADPEKNISVTPTPSVELTSVAVQDYAQAAEVAKKLCDQGIKAIELCGGFGSRGVAMISEAVGQDIPVGVVRFDIHPGLDNKSGDGIF